MFRKQKRSMLVRFPNFLIVGAAKSGTTSLYHYLNQHPEIYMSPVKEPLFFCSVDMDKDILEKEMYPFSLDRVVSNLHDYVDLFSGAIDEKALGEASVYYLLDHKKTIAKIKEYIPNWYNLKIVIMLRNPSDASFSNYQMYSQYLKNVLGQKKILTFEESFKAEQNRINNGYKVLAHFHWFFYYEQVKAYMDNFSDVKVYLQTDMKNNPNDLLADLFEFLGVDKEFVPDNKGYKYNVSGVPRSGFFYKLLLSEGFVRKMVRLMLRLFLNEEQRQLLFHRLWSKNLKKVTMLPETRKHLMKFYHDDIIRLQKLINRDLSEWLV